MSEICETYSMQFNRAPAGGRGSQPAGRIQHANAGGRRHVHGTFAFLDDIRIKANRISTVHFVVCDSYFFQCVSKYE